MSFLTLDEKSGKEKRNKTSYLIQAQSLEAARKNTDIAMGSGMQDYEITSVVETKIMDVYEHKVGNSESEDI